MKYCKKCKKEFNDSIEFCTNCGGDLELIKSSNKSKFSKIIIIIAAILTISYIVFDRIEKAKEANKQRIEANKLMAFAKYKEIGEFGDYGVEGLALVKQEFKDEDEKNYTLYGFINENFEECIPCIFQWIEPFEGEVTIVKLADKFALINKNGEIEKQLKYKNMTRFFDKDEYLTPCSFAEAKGDGYKTLINRKGENLCPEYEDILYQGWNSDDWGKVNINKRLALVKQNGKWGYLDNSFHTEIKCIYDNANDMRYDDNFNKLTTSVCLDGKWGIIDNNGKEVIHCNYDEYFNFEAAPQDFFHQGSVASVCLDGKWGWIDTDEKQVIECIYDEPIGVYNVSSNRSKVIRNGKYGFLDSNGKEVIKCVYDYASWFGKDGEAYVSSDDWVYFENIKDYVRGNFYIDIYGNFLRYNRYSR